MRYVVKLSLTATLLTCAMIGSASATNLSLSNRSFRTVFTPLSFNASVGTVRCNVTMEGTFHANTLVKRSRALIGYITRAALTRPCSGLGEVFIYNGTEGGLESGLSSLPWHISYEGFSGTLPNIASLITLITGFKFSIRGVFGVCLSIYGPFANTMLNIMVSAGTVTEVVPDETQIPESFGNCGAGNFTGRGTFTLLGNTTRVIVRLI